MNVKQILYLDGYECFFHTHTNGCTCEKRKWTITNFGTFLHESVFFFLHKNHIAWEQTLMNAKNYVFTHNHLNLNKIKKFEWNFH